MHRIHGRTIGLHIDHAAATATNRGTRRQRHAATNGATRDLQPIMRRRVMGFREEAAAIRNALIRNDRTFRHQRTQHARKSFRRGCTARHFRARAAIRNGDGRRVQFCRQSGQSHFGILFIARQYMHFGIGWVMQRRLARIAKEADRRLGIHQNQMLHPFQRINRLVHVIRHAFQRDAPAPTLGAAV